MLLFIGLRLHKPDSDRPCSFSTAIADRSQKMEPRSHSLCKANERSHHNHDREAIAPCCPMMLKPMQMLGFVPQTNLRAIALMLLEMAIGLWISVAFCDLSWGRSLLTYSNIVIK
jgi:hypothetical protein